MATYITCLLMLWLTALSNCDLQTTTAPDASHGQHVPREPRVEPPPQHLPLQPNPHPDPPPQGAALDKAAVLPHPVLSREIVSTIACSEDYNCTTQMGENSECHGSICQCNNGAMLSTDSKRCLKESKLGSGCAEDWQCQRPLGNTVYCENKICACIKGAEVVNGKCAVQKRIGEQCNIVDECLKGQNTECVDGRCDCITSMVPAGTSDKCLQKAKNPSDPCEEDIQCTEPFGSGGACTNGKCICQDNYHFRNHVCMRNLKVGDACGNSNEGECFLPHDQGINHVQCLLNKCQCSNDRTLSIDGEKCLSPDQKDPGSGGGADSVQPLLLTLATMLLARFLFS